MKYRIELGKFKDFTVVTEVERTVDGFIPTQYKYSVGIHGLSQRLQINKEVYEKIFQMFNQNKNIVLSLSIEEEQDACKTS